MIQVVRESLEDRYSKYVKNPAQTRQFMEARLQYMPIEEIAYLLAIHDKFNRIGCKEYENEESGLDPLGRKVDPWGKPLKNG